MPEIKQKHESIASQQETGDNRVQLKQEQWNRMEAELQGVRDPGGEAGARGIESGILQEVTAMNLLGFPTRMSGEGRRNEKGTSLVPFVQVDVPVEGWADNPEKRAQKTEANKQKAEEMRVLLAEFYKNKEPNSDSQIVLREHGNIGAFRVQNANEAIFLTLSEQASQEQMQAYQDEMHEFGAFLKEKFFERSETSEVHEIHNPSKGEQGDPGELLRSARSSRLVVQRLAQYTRDRIANIRASLGLKDQGKIPSLEQSEGLVSRMRGREEKLEREEEELWKRAEVVAGDALRSFGAEGDVRKIKANVFDKEFANKGKRLVLSVKIRQPVDTSWTMDIKLTEDYLERELPVVIRNIYEARTHEKKQELQLKPLEDSDFIRGRDQALWQLGEREIQKEDGHIALINRANTLTSELFRRFGVETSDIKAEQIHLIKPQLWNRRIDGVAVPEIEKIFIKNPERLMVLDKKLIHEMLHLKIGNLLPRVFNEGLIEQAAGELVQSQELMPDIMKEELRRSEALKEQEKDRVFSNGEPVVMSDTYFLDMQQDGQITRYNLSYPSERRIIDIFANKISARFPERFSRPDEVKKFLLVAEMRHDTSALRDLERDLGFAVFSEIDQYDRDPHQIQNLLEKI